MFSNGDKLTNIEILCRVHAARKWAAQFPLQENLAFTLFNLYDQHLFYGQNTYDRKMSNYHSFFLLVPDIASSLPLFFCSPGFLKQKIKDDSRKQKWLNFSFDPDIIC